MSATIWILEPRDSLIARDGRPFDPVPGARSRTLEFPFPSTLVGALRTRAGRNSEGAFDDALLATVKDIAVRGAMLVRLDADGQIEEMLAPAPLDALLFEAKQTTTNDTDDPLAAASLQRLVPLKLPPGAMTNMPRTTSDELAPVGLERSDPRKPHARPPRFWRWEKLEAWLTSPRSLASIKVSGYGYPRLPQDARTHVSINPASLTSNEGALFQTRGLEFTSEDARRERFALALVVENMNGLTVAEGIAPLGGERRLTLWRAAQTENAVPLRCPDEIRRRIKDDKACRVMLLTPAHFVDGCLPREALKPRHGVTPEICAARLERAQVISGWDFERRAPKGTRRLAPAGSVFYWRLTLDEKADLDAWIDATWMRALSDEAQDSRDGFGLAALGTWDGELRDIEVETNERGANDGETHTTS